MRRPKRLRVPKRVWKISAKAQDNLCACGCGRLLLRPCEECGDYWLDLTIDHEPALGLRPINDDGSDYIPPQHDPSALRIYIRGHDKNKTYGSGGETRIETRSGDIGKIAHTKRLKQSADTHSAIMRAKAGR